MTTQTTGDHGQTKRPMLLTELKWERCDCGECEAMRAPLPERVGEFKRSVLFREPDGTYHLGSKKFPIDALEAQCLLFKLTMEEDAHS